MNLRGALLTLGIINILVPGSAAAQNGPCTLEEGLLRLPSQPVNVGNRQFTVEISYCERDAWAGNDNLEVKIDLTTLGDKNLRFIEFESDTTNDILSNKSLKSENSTVEDGVLKTEYRLLIGVKKDTLPQIHNVKVRLAQPRTGNETNETSADQFVTFPLNVGVRESGLLKPKPEINKPIVCKTGAPHVFTFSLKNYFPHYPVKIEKITLTPQPAGVIDSIISSNPPGLIVNKTIEFKPPIAIDAAQVRQIQIEVQMAKMTLDGMRNEFFDEPNRIDIGFEYNDDHHRKVSDQVHQIDFKVQAGSYALLFAIILGVLAGTAIKMTLARLRKAGVITRRQQATFAMATILIGITAAVFAWIGRVQVLVLDFRGSYDNPLVVAMIGLAGALAGPALFEKFFHFDKESRPQ